MAKGGYREGAGRKPKAYEIQLIEQMDSILAPAEAWEALANLVRANDPAAIKLWLNYRFGMPKQQIEATGGTIPISVIVTENVRQN